MNETPDPTYIARDVTNSIRFGSQWIGWDAVRDLDVEIAAGALGVTVEDYLTRVEQWAGGIGLMFGLVVDRDAETITQIGGTR